MWDRVAKHMNRGTRQKEVGEWAEDGLLSHVRGSTVKFTQQGPGPKIFLCIYRVNRMQRNVFSPYIVHSSIPTPYSKKNSFLK